MFVSLNEFQQEWKREASLTGKILNTLTDESLDQSVALDHFSLGELGWHLSQAIHGLFSAAGLKFEGSERGAGVPESAKEIADVYEQTSSNLLRAAGEQWTDETLKQSITVFGQETTIHGIMRFVIQHQAHHRGQMTVLMRQAGLVVPGVYGPSKEEREQIGK
ncbi:hypothetical protein YDYSY3_04370 [Paenibacillus chitinolyticus]|uniref:DinB family protein n=1 Tax=Paenibacillus chitinolyticus TaxID=79263 RepID=UPI0026E49A09|nr:DinB family protein [Paenibacillus chitinolyticus]GKS09437.1 hypothetical protein YDYSY3_04370 [Paenibacillus chitinolyticus]